MTISGSIRHHLGRYPVRLQEEVRIGQKRRRDGFSTAVPHTGAGGVSMAGHSVDINRPRCNEFDSGNKKGSVWYPNRAPAAGFGVDGVEAQESVNSDSCKTRNQSQGITALLRGEFLYNIPILVMKLSV